MADDDGYRSLSQTLSDTSSQTSKWDSDRKNSPTRKAVRSAGSSLSASGDRMIADSRDEAASNVHAVQYKRGGKVRKTGPAVVHKGERVISAGKRKKVDRMMKRSGMSMKARR
jgi:hypothetical protein